MVVAEGVGAATIAVAIVGSRQCLFRDDSGVAGQVRLAEVSARADDPEGEERDSSSGRFLAPLFNKTC